MPVSRMRIVLTANPHAGPLRAVDFFAGVGLAQLGLEAAGVDVVWSIDIDPAKEAIHRVHFGDRHATYHLGDIADVGALDLPANLDLAWASFPCVDLSVAGWRRGLRGSQSGMFWEFIRVLREMGLDRPPVVAIENVTGFATSHGGKDLRSAIKALNALDYSVDVLAIDARSFVPQSRSRLFLVALREPPKRPAPVNERIRPARLGLPIVDKRLRTHCADLPEPPSELCRGLETVVDSLPDDDPAWWTQDRVDAFVASLSILQAKRLRSLLNAPEPSHRTAYRRTRDGIPRWEIRSDEVAGCLRTARGGSSRQALVQCGGGHIRVRWLNPRECARLMGAHDYRIDGIGGNQLLFGFGDAVAVPVVTWLSEHYLIPHITRLAVNADDTPQVAA